MRIKRAKASPLLTLFLVLGVCLLAGAPKSASIVTTQRSTGSEGDLTPPASATHKSPRPLPLPVPPALLSDLPLAFTENKGQLDARVAFHLQGRSTAAYFTSQGMTLSLTRQYAGEASTASRTGAKATRQQWNLKLNFMDADPGARPEGRDLTQARVSYFNGPPENWRAGLRTYASIVYRDLWPGIDLVYNGTTDRLKYEFIVKPGADPKRIRLAYRGTNAPLSVNQLGQLEIPTPFGAIRDDKPVARQGRGKQVKAEFIVHQPSAGGSQEYGFKVGKYDKGKTLVIDPAILVYSGFIGGGGDDEGHSIAVDGNGNAYITGVTTSAQATFPETAGPDLIFNGRVDAFVAKIKADGTGLVYAGYIGGNGDDAGHSIAIDSSGAAYVTGWTTSTQATFPTLGGLDPTFNGAIDAFVAKVNPAGTALSYCGYIGGDDQDEGLGIAVDTSGRAYVTGLTASTETTFPKLVGPGLIFKGAIDAFVARVKADGSGLEYAGYIGGGGDDQGRGIAVDTSGNAYVAGLTTSSEATFPMVGALDPTFNGGVDAFVAKINSIGSAISYSGYIGGDGIDEAFDIVVDGSGNAYITGRTTSTEVSFPVLGGPDLSFNGAFDAFVAKVNTGGSALTYAGYIGGSGDDEGFGIAVDNAGNVALTGQTGSGNFPLANAFQPDQPSVDAFITKLNPALPGAASLIYSTYLGGNDQDRGYAVAIDASRNTYITGTTTSSGFPATPGVFQTANAGGGDAFVAKISDQPPNPAPVQAIYLHGIGPSDNPPTLFLDTISPTGATAKFKDSAAINFNGGNPWKEVGVWTTAAPLPSWTLTALSDLRVWLGLKNSDDQGANFDLRVEVAKNGELVAAGETYCIQGVTRNPSLAKEVIVSFAPFSPVTLSGAAGELSLKISTRIGSNGTGGFCGGHSNATGLRLYFDAVSRASKFNATISPLAVAGESAGALDAIFVADGKTNFSNSNDTALSVAAQRDGKIVVAGQAFTGAGADFALARYNSDGSLDAGFGVDGKVTTDFAGSDDQARSVAVQQDGKIVVAGSVNLSAGLDFGLARYNSDGTLDVSFGVGGKITTDFAGSNDADLAFSVAVQQDGRIVVAGRAGNDFGLARYNSDGALDTSFGVGGKVTTDFAGSADEAHSVALQQNGKIVVVGVASTNTGKDFALARYNSDGAFDASFGAGGKITTDFAGAEDEAYSIALQQNGKIVVVGRTLNGGIGAVADFALARYNEDGSIDAGFGAGGKVATDFAGSNDFALSVALQQNGKIVVAGYASNSGSGSDFALARYNEDGALDPGFGAGGKVTTDFGAFDDIAFSVALQHDGKIVVAGRTSTVGAGADFALARYK
ncbi:MAG TPA: SBBP repeat-containing protein [Blastocatellia bacterium]|nr:SBBP repeat-containing protein [Blastocatellia bacterium]